VTVRPIEQLSRWKERFDRIGSDISFLYRSNIIWLDFREHLAQDDHWNETWLLVQWVAGIFWPSQAIGARRHRDTDRDANSFANLLQEVAGNAHVFSRSTYVEFMFQQSEMDEDLAFQKEVINKTFDVFSDGADTISRGALEDDIQLIEESCRAASSVADRLVAHLDKRGVKEVVTYGDVTNAIETLYKLWLKYHPLFDGRARAEWKQQQMLPWRIPLREHYFAH
jgi:hypothetical protein